MWGWSVSDLQLLASALSAAFSPSAVAVMVAWVLSDAALAPLASVRAVSLVEVTQQGRDHA